MRLYNIGIYTALAAVLLSFAPAAVASGSPFSVSGQVVDRYGNPVQGANVTLLDFNHNIIGIVHTNGNGNYDFINVLADTDTVTVRVNLTKNGKAYEIPSYYTRWYPARGMQFINSSETTFPGYPQPTFGYVYGAIQTDMSTSGKFINGIVFLESLDNGVKYYEFAERTDGKGSFTFYAPPGPYVLYAQHLENGVVYESARKQVTIQPNSEVTEVLETRIVLPLNAPSSDPDPAAAPSHQENRIHGTVTANDGKPLAGATVALYQEADNGSAFIPMRGADSRPLTAATDSNGSFTFYGASPTTDDGKPIQAEKDVKAMVGYSNEYGIGQAAWSEPKPLYYPDVLMGNGLESQARDVTLPVLLASGAGTPQQPTVSVSEVPPTASGIAAVPLLAALAIGLVCLVGLYVALNRKG
jgi:protocatechuate 3,4-dioxygenase beta subunit